MHYDNVALLELVHYLEVVDLKGLAIKSEFILPVYLDQIQNPLEDLTKGNHDNI